MNNTNSLDRYDKPFRAGPFISKWDCFPNKGLFSLDLKGPLQQTYLARVISFLVIILVDHEMATIKRQQKKYPQIIQVETVCEYSDPHLNFFFCCALLNFSVLKFYSLFLCLMIYCKTSICAVSYDLLIAQLSKSFWKLTF